ncbi:MAG: permease-like cell division protein FtsX [Ignavibacteria bacterium]|nr:permease-like cell division protein FtsX [Ignavibacteria bacterium]
MNIITHIVNKKMGSILLSAAGQIIALITLFAMSVVLMSLKDIKSEMLHSIKLIAFVKPAFPDERIETIKTQLSINTEIAEINFINSAEAEKIFLENSGKEMQQAVTYAPLPAAFIITLRESTAESRVLLAGKLKAMPDIISLEFDEATYSVTQNTLNLVEYCLCWAVGTLLILLISVIAYCTKICKDIPTLRLNQFSSPKKAERKKDNAILAITAIQAAIACFIAIFTLHNFSKDIRITSLGLAKFLEHNIRYITSYGIIYMLIPLLTAAIVLFISNAKTPKTFPIAPPETPGSEVNTDRVGQE